MSAHLTTPTSKSRQACIATVSGLLASSCEHLLATGTQAALARKLLQDILHLSGCAALMLSGGALPSVTVLHREQVTSGMLPAAQSMQPVLWTFCCALIKTTLVSDPAGGHV